MLPSDLWSLRSMYTVVIATRPDERYILEAMESIQAQTLPPERIIVVVNGPGATEADLSDAVAAVSPNVEVRAIAQPSMSAALANALVDVSTPFVGVLDADDLWDPEKQERQIEMLLACRELDAVACTVVNFSINSDGTAVDGKAASGKMFGAVTFRTDAFERFGLPDAQASHFAWLYRWWAAANAAGIVTASIDHVGLRRRVHDTNGWVTGRNEGRQQLLGELRRITRERNGARGTATGASA